MILAAPFTHVRIEPPDVSVYDLRGMPGLMRIDLHPPASGPEVELVFGTHEAASGPAGKDFIRSEVERMTGRSVLALAVRG